SAAEEPEVFALTLQEPAREPSIPRAPYPRIRHPSLPITHDWNESRIGSSDRYDTPRRAPEDLNAPERAYGTQPGAKQDRDPPIDSRPLKTAPRPHRVYRTLSSTLMPLEIPQLEPAQDL